MGTFKLWLEAEEEWGDGDFADYDNDSGENFWGNVGAGVLPIARSTGRILLNFRSSYVNEPNTWGIWGGKVDDEHMMDLQAEARREFMEESGYNGSIQLTPAYIFKTSGFEYHNFIGVIPDEFEPDIPPQHQWETEGHEWMTFEEVMSVEPKHFGLSGLLQHSGSAIQRLTQG